MENQSNQPKNSHHSRRLLIIGASARAAAESAVRAGFECSAIDLYRDLDLERACKICLRVPTLEKIPQVAQGVAVDVFMYTGCMENRPRIIEELSKTVTLAGCGDDSLAKIRDPFWLADLAKKRGFQFAKCGIRPPKNQETDGGWLKKPYLSCGGRHIEWISDARRAGASAESFFQKHIAGTSVSAAFVAGATRTEILGISRQLVGKSYLGARPFSYCGSLGPFDVKADVENKLTFIGQTLAEEAGLIGLFGIDAIVNANGVTLIEVNPRYTASMEIVDYARGISCVEHHIQACLGRELPPAGPRQRFACKLIQFSTHASPLIVSADFNAWALSTNAPAFISRVADIPPAGAAIGIGAPIFSVIGVGESGKLAFRRAKKLCAFGYNMLGKTVVSDAN